MNLDPDMMAVIGIRPLPDGEPLRQKLTPDALRVLAAVDLLPIGHCPKDGWVPLDCPVLADGLLVRCPCCYRPFGSDVVLFMDDQTRRAHGLEVVIEDQDGPEVDGWPLLPLPG
ncbi:MAG: hypothetical protein ACOYB2_10845 [Limnohabitans sp.]